MAVINDQLAAANSGHFSSENLPQGNYTKLRGQCSLGTQNVYMFVDFLCLIGHLLFGHIHS